MSIKKYLVIPFLGHYRNFFSVKRSIYVYTFFMLARVKVLSDSNKHIVMIL